MPVAFPQVKRDEPGTRNRSAIVIAGAVVALTFISGFGNVWTLILTGARPNQLQLARRLLIFCGTVKPTLDIADPFIASQVGKAAFDTAGALRLIG